MDQRQGLNQEMFSRSGFRLRRLRSGKTNWLIFSEKRSKYGPVSGQYVYFRAKKSNTVKGIYRVWVSGVGSRKHIASYMDDFGAENEDIRPKTIYFLSLIYDI